MAMKLVLAQSRLQHKGRVGVSCTEQNDSRKSTASQLCLRESRHRVFSVCVLQRVQTLLLELFPHWLGFQMRHFIFTHEAGSHTPEHVPSHDFFRKRRGRPGSPGAHSPEVSHVKALTAATGSLDVGVIEHKLTGQFVFHIVHLCS